MKTILPFFVLGFALVLNAAAQERPPVQILPGLALPPPDTAPGQPIDPPEDFPAHIHPEEGFDPGHMFIPDMPGRFQIVSAQIQQNGKAIPIVLKLDTQTGQVWQLKTVTGQVLLNGKPRPFTHLTFVPVDGGEPHAQPMIVPPDAEPDAPGFGIEGGESIPEETPQIEPAPDRIPDEG